MDGVKKFIIVSVILFLRLLCLAQNGEPMPQEHVQVSFGRSWHGSGDMTGFTAGAFYNKYLKKRLSFSLGLETTIHDGQFDNYFTSPSGAMIDGSIRYTTAGIQLAGHFGFSAVRNHTSDLQLKAGVIVRYQSSSLYDIVTIYYPPITGLPVPVIVIENSDPQRTLALGGSIQASYCYTFSKNYTLGLVAAFQIDTNGDVLRYTAFSVGKRF